MLNTSIAGEDAISKDAVGESELDANTQSDFHEVSRAAIGGDPEAQKKLGDIYFLGNDAVQDYKQAAMWYEKAAEQGIMTVRRDLGIMYYQGLGIEQSNIEAYKWFDLAAMSSYESAVRKLEYMSSVMSQQEITIARQKAVEWLIKVANKGEPFAQLQLGQLYAEGDHVQKDCVVAFKWLSIAQVSFSYLAMAHPDADDQVNHLIAGLSEEMTSAQLAEATNLANKWIDDFSSSTE